jgi:hypothetical protein
LTTDDTLLLCERANKAASPKSSGLLLFHLAIMIVLKVLEEVKEVTMSFNSTLASIEDHKNEDELRELIVPPLLLFVHVLEYAIEEQVLLVFLIDDAVYGDFDAYVLKYVESELQ